MRHAFVRIFYLLNSYCLNALLLQLFQKNGYDLHAYNNVRDILYNNDVITNIVKSIVHSLVGQNERDLLRATAVTVGGTDTEILARLLLS